MYIFACFLIILEKQMMMCILELSMSIFQNRCSMHCVLTRLAQWRPIAADTAICTYTTSPVTVSILWTFSTVSNTVQPIFPIWTCWKTKKNRNCSCNIIMEVLGVRKYNSPLLQKSIYYCNWLQHFQQHPLFSEYQRIPHKEQLMVFGSSCWSNQHIKYFSQTAASCSRAPRLCSQKINNLMSWVVIVQDSNEQYGSESEESEQDTSSDVCLSVSSVIDTYVSFAPIYS